MDLIMNDLILFHPVTKERIDFSVLDCQELTELELVTHESKTITELKAESIKARGDEVPRSMADFTAYCGKIILMAQKYRSLKSGESAVKKLGAYRRLVVDLASGSQDLGDLVRRAKELLAETDRG
jgi:hypothetical protein